MKANAPRFPVLEVKHVDERAFVEFWAAKYPTINEPIYQAHIGKPLTEKRLLELFRWKNNGPIAKHKLKSIRRNYIQNKPAPPALGDVGALQSFITQPGGAIWRIFWLHCYDPSRYPIFDQHVYRAMCRLTRGRAEEIPETNHAKATAYVEQYLPFHARLTYKNRKKIDEALWSYGKYLKSWNAL
jgi:hypothetical protein